MRPYKFTLAANGEDQRNVTGNFLRVDRATVDLIVETETREGKPISSLVMPQGRSVTLPEVFDKVRVKNTTGGAVTATLEIGIGLIGDNELTGTISVNQGTTLTQSTHTVGVAAAVLLAADSTRKSVIIQNRDAANSIYLGDATVTTANGLEVAAGREITLDKAAAAAIYAIGAAAGIDVRTLEEAA